MLNYPITKLSAILDDDLDLNDFAVIHDVVKISDEKRKLKKEILSNLLEISKEKIFLTKIKEDVRNLFEVKSDALQKRNETKKKTEEKLKEKNIVDQKKAVLTKIMDLYRKNLGFRMEKVKSTAEDTTEQNSVLFLFDNISKSDPQQTFSLILTIDGPNYEVRSCQPLIDSLDELVSELCESNNLYKFIIQIRRRFCEIASTSIGKN